MGPEVTRRGAFRMAAVGLLGLLAAPSCTRKSEETEIKSLEDIAGTFDKLRAEIKTSSATKSPIKFNEFGTQLDDLQKKLEATADALGVLWAPSRTMREYESGPHQSPGQELHLTVSACANLTHSISEHSRRRGIVDREELKFLIEKFTEAQVACRRGIRETNQ